MFRVGLLLAICGLVSPILGLSTYSPVLLVTGISVLLVGVLATHTPNENVRVEVADET